MDVPAPAGVRADGGKGLELFGIIVQDGLQGNVEGFHNHLGGAFQGRRNLGLLVFFELIAFPAIEEAQADAEIGHIAQHLAVQGIGNAKGLRLQEVFRIADGVEGGVHQRNPIVETEQAVIVQEESRTLHLHGIQRELLGPQDRAGKQQGK